MSLSHSASGVLEQEDSRSLLAITSLVSNRSRDCCFAALAANDWCLQEPVNPSIAGEPRLRMEHSPEELDP